MEKIKHTNQKLLDDSRVDRAERAELFYNEEMQNELMGYGAGRAEGGLRGLSSSVKQMTMENIYNKVKAGMILTDQDKQSMSQLSLQAQMTFGSLNRETEVSERKWLQDKLTAEAQRGYYKKIGQYQDAMIAASKQGTQVDPMAVFKLQQAMTMDRDELLKDLRYNELRPKFEKVGDKWAAKRDSKGKEIKGIERGELEEFESLQASIDWIESLMGQANSLLQTNQADSRLEEAYGIIRELQRRLEGGAQPQPQPEQQVPTQQPGSVDQLSRLGELVGEGEVRRSEAMRLQGDASRQLLSGLFGGKDKKKMRKISESSGVPLDRIVHIDELANLSSGDYQRKLEEFITANKLVFFDDKLHDIVSTGGKWGLIPMRR